MPTRKATIIIGNWKMNPISLKEAERLFKSILLATHYKLHTEVVICPPFLYLERLKKLLPRRSRATGSKKISLCAQDAFWQDVGAYTGEVSPDMLYNAGVKYVILGHSERRSPPSALSGGGGGETNEIVNKKIKAALKAGLRPVLCVGESARDESHSYFNLVKAQLGECLAGVSKNSVAKIAVAYEPIWAISSTTNRKDATSADSREMAIFIRKILTDKFGSEAAKVRIIYGGSANEKNAEDFLKNGGVDGLLPGRASLDAKKFSQIISIAESIS